MPTFERGDLVAVPFPYVERPVLESRPALVVAAGMGATRGLCWVLMVTSADNPRWPGDLAIDAPATETGLRTASVIRTAKIATIDAAAARRIGAVPPQTLVQVDALLRSALGPA